VNAEPQLVLFMATKQFPNLALELEKYLKLSVTVVPFQTPIESLPNMDEKVILYVICAATERPSPKWDEFERLKNLSKDTVLLILRFTDNVGSLGSWDPQPKTSKDISTYALSTFNNQVKVIGIAFHETGPDKKATLLSCNWNKNQLEIVKLLVGGRF